jgi:hypothetical protein
MHTSTDRILTTHAGSIPRGEPLGQMLMRELWRQAHLNGEMDVGLATQACQIAKDCAPFVHPRLASVEARIDAVGRVEVAIDLIRQEERLIFDTL